MKLILIFLLTLTSVAQADIIHKNLLKKEKFDWNDEHKIAFAANGELGRAWVKILEGDRVGDDGGWWIEKILVEGLSYYNDEVIFEKDGQTVVCARKEMKGLIFKRTKYEATGNCYLEKTVMTEDYDDGFYIKQKKYVYLNLVIQDNVSQLKN